MAIFVGYSQKRRTVRIASPGDDKFAIGLRSAAIQLQATLTDISNLRNHTIYWKQMTGNPVVLFNPYSLNASYNFVENSNKRFRFYLDYNTNKEQYADIEVFHTPTSIMGDIRSEGFSHNIDQTIPNYLLTPDFIVPFDDYAYAPVIITPAIRITYSAVDPVFRVLGTGMEVLTDNGYTQNPQTIWKSFNYGNYPLTLLLPKGVYKFLFRYTAAFGEIDREYYSPLIVSTPKEEADSNDLYANDPVAHLRSLGNFQSIKRTSHIIKNFEDFPYKTSRSMGEFLQATRYTNNNRYFLDTPFNTSRSLGQFYSIIRYDSSGIGS